MEKCSKKVLENQKVKQATYKNDFLAKGTRKNLHLNFIDIYKYGVKTQANSKVFYYS